MSHWCYRLRMVFFKVSPYIGEKDRLLSTPVLAGIIAAVVIASTIVVLLLLLIVR